MLCIFSGSKAFSISSVLFLKSLSGFAEYFSKENRKKESRYEVLTMKKNKRKRINWRVPLGRKPFMP
ncbi:hypothetical protein A1704_05945 [Chryseobacterium cucumeris]|nr:hypothetical protein A1704_05945 [Chryseobacterium cucumeris]